MGMRRSLLRWLVTSLRSLPAAVVAVAVPDFIGGRRITAYVSSIEASVEQPRGSRWPIVIAFCGGEVIKGKGVLSEGVSVLDAG